MKERNRSIDIFRYVCAVLVIAIHTNPGEDISSGIGYIFTQILPRVAVPFFFLVAGYFYIKALENHKKVFWPYLMRTLKTYALWSAFYLAIDFVTGGYHDIPGFFTESIIAFLLTGSHYHFWFFPALIFSACLVTFLYKTRLQKLLLPLTVILYAIGCLCCSYRFLGDRIPVLSSLFSLSYFIHIRRILLMGLPFFAAGLLVLKVEGWIKAHQIRKSAISLALLAAVLCWLLEIGLVIGFQLQENIILTFGLYPLTVAVMVFLLYHPMPKAKRISEKCRVLAEFTYYSHPFIIKLLSFAAKLLIKQNLPETLMFLLTVALTWGIGNFCYYPIKRKR